MFSLLRSGLGVTGFSQLFPPQGVFFCVVFQCCYHTTCYFYFSCKIWCIQVHLQTYITMLHGIPLCIWSSFHSSNQAVAPFSFILTSSVEQMSQPQLLEIFEPDSCKYSKATIRAQNYNWVEHLILFLNHWDPVLESLQTQTINTDSVTLQALRSFIFHVCKDN